MTPYIISQCENHTIQERKCLPTFILAIIVNFNGFEETIADFQWFLRRPSPLNVFWRSDHCHQWFFNGFFILLPLLSMVFDGSGPLVKRCDGFNGSLWSTRMSRSIFILTVQAVVQDYFLIHCRTRVSRIIFKLPVASGGQGLFSN